MTKKQWYRVGGHDFCLTAATDSPLLDNMTNCHPFRITEEEAGAPTDVLFRMAIEESVQKPAINGNFIIQFEGEDTYIDLYETEEENLLFSIAGHNAQKHTIALLKVEVPSYQAVLTLAAGLNTHQKTFVLNNALMLLYALSSACRHTLLIHASVIACKGKAYVFLGKSGTGKSTHSSLWLQYIKDTYLLNDDNPIIRIHEGKITVYGSPWSGKTPCYLNKHMPLGGIVRLSQAPQNKIEPLKGAAAYAAIAPSASAIRWKRQYADGLHATLSELASMGRIYHLQCLPNEEAACICHATISKPAER